MNKVTLILMLFSANLFSQTYYFTNENQNIPLSATSINSMDVESVDIDNDGDLDLFIAGEYRRNLLLFNDGNGVFTEDSTKLFPDKNPRDSFTGEDSEDIALADFDQDDDLDVFFATEDTPNHELLINDGTGKFTFINYNFPNSLGEAVAVLDLNNDNYPDIIIGVNGQNRVYINNQDLTFTEDPTRWPTNSEGTQDLKLVDLDNDNDLDIIEGIDAGTNNILINNNGFFSDESNRLPNLGVTIETRKVTVGDLNNDGFVDLFYSNVNFTGNANMRDRLFLNDGNGFFIDATSSNFPLFVKQSLDAIFIDYDFDNDLDILSVGFLDPTLNYHFFENNGDAVFTETTGLVVAPFVMTDGITLHVADFNNDSYPDIYLGNFQQSDDILFYNPNALSTINNSLLSEINIYPNPTKNKFKIELNIDYFENLTIDLFNHLGKKINTIFKGNFNSKLLEIDISNNYNLTAGTYFLRFTLENHSFNKPLIITK